VARGYSGSAATTSYQVNVIQHCVDILTVQQQHWVKWTLYSTSWIFLFYNNNNNTTTNNIGQSEHYTAPHGYSCSTTTLDKVNSIQHLMDILFLQQHWTKWTLYSTSWICLFYKNNIGQSEHYTAPHGYSGSTARTSDEADFIQHCVDILPLQQQHWIKWTLYST
jgi:hypothetical protein